MQSYDVRKRKMEGVIYIPKWCRVLVEIYKMPEQYRYCQKINRGVKISINHLRSLIQVMVSRKLIEVIPSRKIKKLRLTEKGAKVAVSVMNIESELR